MSLLDNEMTVALDELKANTKVCRLKTAFDQVHLRMLQLSSKCSVVSSGDLTKKELLIVDYVGNKKMCIMRDIAEFLNAPVSTLTSIIDKLVRKKQLYRERSDEDRRIVNVLLGSEGENTYEVFDGSKYFMSSSMLDALDEDEQDELIRLLSKVSKNAK